jgi:pantoate--beta-alanine ligase
MRVLRSIDELRSIRAHSITNAQKVGFVPTMGALHLGHAELMKVASDQSDISIASIFINPKQFNSASDLAKYPRTIDDDLAICTAC